MGVQADEAFALEQLQVTLGGGQQTKSRKNYSPPANVIVRLS
jgi:hypothetical protein